MTTDERVERVEKAIADAKYGPGRWEWLMKSASQIVKLPTDELNLQEIDAYRDMARAAIAALDAEPPADRERALRDEVARLRGKCNRLIDYMGTVEDALPIVHWEKHKKALLNADDLTPEPNDTASEPPVSHGAANDTKPAKSITSDTIGPVTLSNDIPIHANRDDSLIRNVTIREGDDGVLEIVLHGPRPDDAAVYGCVLLTNKVRIYRKGYPILGNGSITSDSEGEAT